MNKAEKEIEKARKKSIELAWEYGVRTSQVVWAGGNNFIICFEEGEEIKTLRRVY